MSAQPASRPSTRPAPRPAPRAGSARPLRPLQARAQVLPVHRRDALRRDAHGAGDRARSGVGAAAEFTVEGGEMDAVLGFVRAGLGLAVLPGMVAARSGLRVTPFAGPGLQRTISVAHRKDVAPPRAARELRRIPLEQLRADSAEGSLPPGTRSLLDG
ncbi:LysR family transcriptional regulator substrate-binding protein [Streptomyces sp. H27-D2]|nr:LysR family transcriptional regulator substrate-binding protein [Streptomyces sp. H27-D2]MEC4015864.1 LysR family transcriptional regulator substrate-binding protein [Streptomyces sp. H27-D2]